MDIMQLVKSGSLVIGVVVSLQIIKELLSRKSIRFKNEDNWLWITFALGVPMALVSQGIEGWSGFNIWKLIQDSFLYAASSVIIYKTYKVGGKSIKEIFDSKKTSAEEPPREGG